MLVGRCTLDDDYVWNQTGVHSLKEMCEFTFKQDFRFVTLLHKNIENVGKINIHWKNLLS